MKPIVKYDNELNMIPLKGVTQVENSVFFALLFKLKNQGTNEVILNFSELKELIDFQQNSEHIRKSIKGITKKIAQSIVEYTTVETTKFFTLFQVLEIPNQGDYYIKAQVSEPFAHLINNMQNNFTAFEIAEFSILSSRYTQTLYRLLKQFKKTGFLKLKWTKFCEIMDIPKSYNMGTIDNQIIKPSMKELGKNQNLFNTTNPIFKNLKMKKIRGKGRGRPVEYIEFFFTPEKNTYEKFLDMGIVVPELGSNDVQKIVHIEKHPSKKNTAIFQVEKYDTKIVISNTELEKNTIPMKDIFS